MFTIKSISGLKTSILVTVEFSSGKITEVEFPYETTQKEILDKLTAMDDDAHPDGFEYIPVPVEIMELQNYNSLKKRPLRESELGLSMEELKTGVILDAKESEAVTI